MRIDEAGFRDAIKSSNSLFDIVVFNSQDIPEFVKVISPDDVDRDVKSTFTVSLGAFPVAKSSRLMQRMAARVARKLAARYTGAFDVSISGLQHAWFYPIFSELTSLVPIRHLARSYAKAAPDQVIGVRLETGVLTALNGWGENFSEPIYLACELRRRGVPVFLFLPENLSRLKLSFQLSDKWLPRGCPRYFHDPEFGSVLCKNAIRRPEFLTEQTGIGKRVTPGVLSRFVINRFRRRACRFDIQLLDGGFFGGTKVYAAAHNGASLDTAFVRLVGPLTTWVRDWFRSELSGKQVQIAHVADHASLEAGLLGAEVVRGGGKIRIWPHSANVVQPEAHDPRCVSHVTVAVRSTGWHWAKAIGPEKVAVNAKTILPDVSAAPTYEAGQPLHVVLFAGAHSLRRLPLMSYKEHKASWKQTLTTLSEADVNFFIKHKSSWETREWITRRVPNMKALPFSSVHANKLRLPNMVFLCVSATSTAILEGIARGIPGIVVRDIPIDETPYYDPASVPILASDQLGSFLSALNSKSAWEALVEKQRKWFQQETAQ